MEESKRKLPNEILYSTTNDEKLRLLQILLGEEYKVISLKDVGIKSQTEEDGVNPTENALKKAKYCFEQTGKPSLAMDFGFFIDGLSDDEQPGPSVKRIIPISKVREPSDEEVLDFYRSIITRLGGKVKAHWIRALAYVSEDGEFTKEIMIPKILVDIPSEKRRKGYPMTSIQIDPLTDKYECELTDEERAVSHKYEDDVVKDFIQTHLHN